MQYFQNFEYEIKINIFKYVYSPLNLALTCRNWSVIAKDQYAKSEWLIVHYGKERALFHAVRLGLTFIDIALCQTLILRKVIMPRCFTNRQNQNLIELKIERNADRIHDFLQKIKSHFASNLLISVFTYL